MVYKFLRPLLFLQPPEIAHHNALRCLNFFYPPRLVKKKIASFPQKPVKLLGLNFPNPIGLAAGFDKNGDCIDALFGFGFGFIEVGTITPKPQAGNPKPRLFRISRANALINHMGFNNRGVDCLVGKLKERKIKGIVGVNIGKNFSTPLDQALNDYDICFSKVYAYANYVTINISSPNTPNLRDLHAEKYLHDLLGALKERQHQLAAQYHRYVPLLLKISPDLNTKQIKSIAKNTLEYKIDGIIAVNTTRSRIGVEHMKHSNQGGGLSGEPLFPTTLKIVKELREYLGEELPIIAVGGVSSGKNAADLLAAGASLVQLYTGLIYQGPALIREIIKTIS